MIISPFLLLNATEAAAIASHQLAGQGNAKGADSAAVEAMRDELNKLDIKAQIVIGEGERDEAPMLYFGEKLGRGWRKNDQMPELDIAVDPLEGTELCANLQPGAISIMAVAQKGGIMSAPDIYMEKIAADIKFKSDKFGIQAGIANSINHFREIRGLDEVKVSILDRERHLSIINEARESGARVKLFKDGDIIEGLLAVRGDSIYAGIGGAPEGVILAAILYCLKGYLEVKFVPRNNEERTRLKEIMGSTTDSNFNPDQILGIHDIIKKDPIVIASGVTSGPLLEGVIINKDGLVVHSVIITPQETIYIKRIKRF